MSNVWKKFNNHISKLKCLSSSQLPSDEDQIQKSPEVPITINYFKSHTDDWRRSFDGLSEMIKFSSSELATVFASQRFFFSSPGRSNSIFDYSTWNSSSESSNALLDGGIAFSKYSPDPYADFRQSMQEMVESRHQLVHVKDDWDYLHELLLCYLSLNPKHAHKYITSAFADLIVTLMSEKS